MSVQTTASESICSAKEHLKEASAALIVAMFEETWGNSDFSEEYIETLEDVFMVLKKSIRRL